MHLVVCERPASNIFLVCDFKIRKETVSKVLTQSLNESSLPDVNEVTDCVIFKGKNLSEIIKLGDVTSFANDDFFLIGHSVFALHEKYYTISKIKFFKPETEEEELNSHDLTEKLKEKNKNIPLFSANLLLALTKNLKFCYINLDSLLYDAPANIKNHKMVMFDKIYG